MTCPTREEAKEIFEEFISARNSSEFPLTKEQEETLRKHCNCVAEIACKIAEKTGTMNSEKAYIMGLLHDCGRIKDEKAENVFHGLVGYEYMMSKGYDEIAKISLSHCFYKKDFDISTYPQCREDILKSKQIVSRMEYDDYDYLLQISDILNNMGKTCSIEYRFRSISERYNIPNEKILPMIDLLNERKRYFDKKCDCDIYQMLGIKEV